MKRLKWLGHIERMDDQRVPKQVLYGESVMGKKKFGRPKLRYIDQIKSDMKNFNIDMHTWQTYSSDRTMWRTIIRSGSTCSEDRWKAKQKAKQDRRRHRRALHNQPD